MHDDPGWSVTIQLGDQSGRKVATESLGFKTREKALEQLASFNGGEIIRPKQIYTLENENGEQISFLGDRYISNSLVDMKSMQIDF
jgi:hypothetical protein